MVTGDHPDGRTVFWFDCDVIVGWCEGVCDATQRGLVSASNMVGFRHETQQTQSSTLIAILSDVLSLLMVSRNTPLL